MRKKTNIFNIFKQIQRKFYFSVENVQLNCDGCKNLKFGRMSNKFRFDMRARRKDTPLTHK